MQDLINMFLEYGNKKIYKANDVIFNENELCDEVSFIKQGKVKISTITPSEDEVIINLLNNNSFFGDLLLFSNNPYYYGIGVCLEASIIYSLKKEILLKLLYKDNKYLEQYLLLVSNKGVFLKQQNKLFAHKNIEERLLYYFNHICKKDSDNTIYFKSITDIANTLSIPRVSLSRVLHKMEKENKLKILKHKIKL